MGKKDVREVNANRWLADARKKRGEAERILSKEPRNADQAYRDAKKAEGLIFEALRVAESAAKSAEELTTAAQNRASRELLEEARAFKAALEEGKLILEVAVSPTDRAKQRKLAEILKDGGKRVAADQLKSSAMVYVAQAATGHAVDGLISLLGNLPPGSGKAARWTGGALSEAVDAGRTRWRRARTGVDETTGTCTGSRMCHNCRYNQENPGSYRACLRPS